MSTDVFDIDKFNIIQDEENYYVFRALNNADHSDIENHITTGENGIDVIRTDRERFEENGRKAKYSRDREISLEEVWDHIKIRYIKETNCISLSSNSNVSMDYGQSYNNEYVMIKVPKTKQSEVYNAGKYMLEEVNKKINDVLEEVSNDSQILDIIKMIDEQNTHANVKKIVADGYEGIKNNVGNYSGIKNRLKNKTSVVSRFDKKQYFSKEQQLEYSKIIAKLTVLEAFGKLRSILPTQPDNTSLIATIGLAFSSGELIHYKDIESEKITEVSKEIMNILTLIQQMKDKDPKNQEIKDIEHKFIGFINNGYKFSKENGKVFFKNENQTIEIDNKFETNENSTNNESLSVEGMYELTKGKVSYKKSIIAVEFAKKLAQSKLKASKYAELIQMLANASDELVNRMKSECFIIDKDIISREDNIGLRIAESVNIGLTRQERAFVSNNEQLSIINAIQNLTYEQLKKIVDTNGLQLESSLLDEILLENNKEISENQYFAEAIVDGIDFGKIYKTISEGNRVMTQDDRKKLVKKLISSDCKNIYNSFIKAGVNPNEVSGYVINLLMDNGYKGYTLEDLSHYENLDDIIGKNLKNLNNKIQALRLDKLLDIEDDSYIVPETEIKLRDYQYDTVKNIEEIFADKRFASMVLPTGAGKSFVAMAEMMDFKNSNIIFIAPQNTILSQFQTHIIKNILKRRDVDTKDYSKVIKEAFPHLKMYCYDTIGSKDDEWIASHDADFIILDELHRSGAKTWQPQIKKLMELNPSAKILGMTATPIRDVDNKDMARALAEMTEEYTTEELDQKKYLASEMHLLDAMQDEIVVSPKVVTFDYTLKDSQEYQEMKKLIAKEKDSEKKEELKQLYKEMTRIIKNSEKQGINGILAENIKKKNGRYIVFLPNNTTELSSEEYIKAEIEKVKEYFKDVNPKIKTSYLLSDRERAKIENTRALEEFENTDSDELKLIFAINMLNEGVHVDGIDGAVMLRPISENSKILYLQQIGRCIYSLNPDKPISDDDRPIIFDVYNNYLAQNMDREVNKTNSTSDLQRLQAIANWIERHKGYIPDINSENLKEARKANSLKNIQRKYKRYVIGIKNNNLTEIEKYEIERILEIGKTIGLWDLEIPDRVICDGEKNIERNDTFKVTGTQKEFLDLFKRAKKSQKVSKLSDALRVKNAISILDFLTEYGFEINNDTVKLESSLEEVLKEVPEEISRTIFEEIENLGVDKKFEIGKEYNFVKEKFFKGNTVFNDYELCELRRYGIFEPFVYSKKNRCAQVELSSGFIVYFGPIKFRSLNIETGTRFGLDGYDINGYNEEGYDKNGFDQNGRNKEGYDIYGYGIDGYNTFGRDREGYMRDGYHYITGLDREGFNREGFNTQGFDKDGYNKRGYNLEGYDRQGFNRNGYNKKGYHKDTNTLYDKRGFDEKGKHQDTGTLYDPKGFDKYGFNEEGYDENGLNKQGCAKEKISLKPIILDNGIILDENRFDSEGYFYKLQEDGTYKNTMLKYNTYGFGADKKHKITKLLVDIRRFDIEGKCKDNNDSFYDKNGFRQDGTYKNTGEKFYNGYNAFGVDKNGRNHKGNVHKDIIFTKNYIDAVMQGKRNDFIKQNYAINKINMNFILSEIDIRVYRASEMYPSLKKEIAIKVLSMQRAILQRENRIKDLNNENKIQRAEIEKLLKENEVLRQRILYINPLYDIEK